MGTIMNFHRIINGCEGEKLEIEFGTTSAYNAGTTLYMNIGDKISLTLTPEDASTFFDAMSVAHAYLSEILPAPGEPIDDDLV